jgi:diphthamide biosynthesis protein 2
MTSTFSTSDENAITRTLDTTPDTSSNHLSQEQFDNFYDIERTADEISQGNYKRVRLFYLWDWWSIYFTASDSVAISR